MKEDFLGNELNIGDKVAYIRPGYRSLMMGTILSFSEQTALLTCNIKYNKKFRQFYEQIVKINE